MTELELSSLLMVYPLDARTARQRPNRKLRVSFGQSYQGGGSLEWRYCFLGLTGRLGGRPVGLYRFWKMNTAPKRPPLQEGAERPPPFPQSPRNKHFPTRVNRHASPLEAKISISKLVLGKLKWTVLPIPPK